MKNKKDDLQRRKHCRYVFKHKDDFIAVIDETSGTRPLDISLTGIAFQDIKHELIPKVDCNKVITINIQDEEKHISLNVRAIIRWILFDSFGAEFINLDKDKLNTIKQIINVIEENEREA
jgi:hypothetical protein